MRLTIAQKLFLAFAGVVAAAVAGTAFVSLLGAERLLDRELSAHLAGAAGVAAAAQRGDLVAALRPGDEQTLVFRNAAERLERLRREAHLEDAFITDRDGRLLVGLGDRATIGAEELRLQLDAAETAQAWSGGRPVGTRYLGRDGRPYRAAYAALVDAGGRPAALLGVEASADYYAALAQLRRRSWAVGGAALVVALAIAWLIGRSLLRPIRDLSRVAESIGDDPYDASAPPRRSDEFALLADSFDRLRRRIRARDVELARRAEEALARERRLGERTLASLSSGILTVAPDGAVSSFNPAAATILDASDPAALAERLRAVPELAGLLHAGDGVNAELELEAAGGTRAIAAAVSRLPDDAGTRLLVLDDVTERRDLERRFHARETLAMLGELSAGVAHEIRNPLNGIQLLLGVLARDVDGRPRALAERAQQEIEGLNQIVSNFLQYARPLSLEVGPVELHRIVDATLLLAAPDLEKRRLRVRRSLEELSLHADGEQLKRALLNLVLNAAQASPDGAEIVVEGARRGERVRIAVRDGGAGVDAAVRERLFTPFVTGRPGGTGLGLALAQKIANLHGGECRLEATGPTGSTFALELPA